MIGRGQRLNRLIESRSSFQDLTNHHGSGRGKGPRLSARYGVERGGITGRFGVVAK
jgi:hypothetical protein